MLPGYPTRRSSRRKGRKRGKVTSHAQNMLGQACIVMHILAHGSAPIVGRSVRKACPLRSTALIVMDDPAEYIHPLDRSGPRGL